MILGIDIGGTKCAASCWTDGSVREIARVPTRDFAGTVAELCAAIDSLPRSRSLRIGVSCGGPLDVGAGVILNPPNLSRDWHGVPICARLVERFGGRAKLMNDANACALAEWRFGAGRGARHMVFLTSGTGMGAGLILNGQLYEGGTGDAGEIGHVRLAPDGPLGYGKCGSVEGFASGGGIARLAEYMMRSRGRAAPAWMAGSDPATAKQIAEAARTGDVDACAVMAQAGTRLGEAIAILIDLFNPDRIVIGGFYPLSRDLLEPRMRATLGREALPTPLAHCAIVPGELGETIGSHGAIAAAMHLFDSEAEEVCDATPAS